MVVHADTAGLITQTAGHRFAAIIQGGVAANRSALVGHVARDVHVTDALGSMSSDPSLSGRHDLNKLAQPTTITGSPTP
jgi:hypothetical protein